MKANQLLDQREVLLAPPALALIAVNVLPLVGVLFWGWTLFEVVVLYWFENVVIGGINVLKMITCAPDKEHLVAAARSMSNKSADGETVEASSSQINPGQPSGASAEISAAGHHAMKLFFVPFFVFHYGMFCFVHGIFVFALLGENVPFQRGGPVSGLTSLLGQVLAGGTLVAALALMGSHFGSFLFHFFWRGEFRRTSVVQLMVAPYARVVVLHVAILFGAFAIMALGQPLILVLLLIGGKTLLDWRMHVGSHGKLTEAVDRGKGTGAEDQTGAPRIV